MRRFLTAVFLLFVLCGVTGVAASAEEELEFSWGTVTAVGSGQFTISEFDYNTDMEVKVVYCVNADTEFKNAGSLANIAVGNDVEVDFAVENGKKIAKVVLLEVPYQEEPQEEGIEEEYE